VEQTPADVVARLIVIELDVIIEVVIEEKGEEQSAVDPQKDKFKHSRH